MTQRSDKNTRPSKRANAGCMWGMIRMFSFHHSISWTRFIANPTYKDSLHLGQWYKRHKVKMLTDFKRKQEDLDNTNKVKAKEVISGMNNRRERVESKVKFPKHSSRVDSELIKLEESRSHSDINHMATKSNRKTVCNMCTNDLKLPTSSETEHHILSKQLEKMPDNLGDLLEELDSSNKNDQEILTKIFPCNGILDARINAQGLQHAEEYKHIMEALSSKGVFQKVCEDPNSSKDNCLHKHSNGSEKKLHTEKSYENVRKLELSVGDCRDPVNHKTIQPQKSHKHVLKDEPLVRMISKRNDSQNLERTTIRNFCQGGVRNASNSRVSNPPSHYACNLRFDNEEKRIVSLFSFQEIKRRLKKVIGENGKSKSMIARDGIMHKIPLSFSSAGKSKKPLPFNINEAETTSSCVPAHLAQRKESKSNPTINRSTVDYVLWPNDGIRKKDIKTTAACQPINKDPNIGVRRCFYELLYGNDDNGKKFLRKESESLGKLLAFPEYDQQPPGSSHEKHTELFMLPRSMNISIKQGHKEEIDQELFNETHIQIKDCISVADLLELDSNSSHAYSQIQDGNLTIENPSLTGVMQDIIRITEGDNSFVYILSKGANEDVSDPDPECSSHELDSCSCLDVSQERQMPVSAVKTTASLSTDDIGTLTRIGGKLKQPYFVSITKPFVSAKYTVQPRQPSLIENVYIASDSNLQTSNLCVHDDEFKFEYLKALLEASGLCNLGAVETMQLPHQFLNPSLYDEVETPSEEIPDDLRLFFDCANEAVEEIYKKSSTSMPWVSHLIHDSRPFPSGEHLIQEAWKGLNSIFVLQSPTTLEQIIKRDLNVEVWVDTRNEAQDTRIEMEDMIFKELLEEILLDLRHDSCQP